MGRVSRWFRERLGSLARGDLTREGPPPVENTDAYAAVAHGRDTDFGSPAPDSNMPPGYVKAYDEGRPRK